MSFGGGGGGQQYVPPPPPPPPPPNPPTMADASVMAAGARSRGGKAAGLASTIMTSPAGDLSAPSTAKKTLGG